MIPEETEKDQIDLPNGWERYFKLPRLTAAKKGRKQKIVKGIPEKKVHQADSKEDERLYPRFLLWGLQRAL